MGGVGGRHGVNNEVSFNIDVQIRFAENHHIKISK